MDAYLADAIVGGLLALASVGPNLPVFVPNLDVSAAPNYPSTPDGVTFDALSATIKSFGGADVALPAGVELAIQLVGNAGQGDEYIVLEAVFTGSGGPLVINAPSASPPQRASATGVGVVDSGDTYDVRARLRSTGGLVTIQTAVTIEISATARVVGT